MMITRQLIFQFVLVVWSLFGRAEAEVFHPSDGFSKVGGRRGLTPAPAWKKNHLSSAALRVRGGAGVDPVVTSKLISSIYMLQGVSGFLAPEKSLEAYNIHNPGPLTKALHEDLSGMVSAIAVATHASLFHGCSTQTSLGLAGIPLLLTFSRWLLNGTEIWMPTKNAVALWFVGVLTTYSGLFHPSWANKFLSFLSYFFMANGGVGMIFPKVWASAFEVTCQAKVHVVMHRMLAAAIGGFGLLMRGFLDGATVPKSLACAVSPAVVNLLAVTFIWKEADEVGMKVEWTIFWSVLLGGYVAMTLV